MSMLTELRARRDEMLADLRGCVERETPSRDKARCDGFVPFFAALAERYGAAVERIANPQGGDHLRLRWGAPGDGAVVLLGHYDTVWPAGTIERKPFVVEDGVARGPGVFDMKGGLVVALWAARTLHESGRLAERALTFIVNSDEEIGSPASRRMIEEAARGSRAVLVFEAPHHGAVKTARKGVGMYDLEITGRAAHAGLEPEKGVNAIDELARATLAIHALNDVAKGTSASVTVVAGGTVRNTIAPAARAEIDVRVATTGEAERVEKAMRALRAHHAGASLTVSGGLNRPPMERTPGTQALFERAAAIAREMGYELREASVGGGSDGNFAAAAGANVLDGLGPLGDGAHAEHEHVVVDSLPERAGLVAELVAAL